MLLFTCASHSNLWLSLSLCCIYCYSFHSAFVRSGLLHQFMCPESKATHLMKLLCNRVHGLAMISYHQLSRFISGQYDFQNAPHISVTQMNYYHQTLIEKCCLSLTLKMQRGFISHVIHHSRSQITLYLALCASMASSRKGFLSVSETVDP